MVHSKLKSGTVTIKRSFTMDTYEYVQEHSRDNNRLTLMYSGSPNWQTPSKVALSLREGTIEDFIMITSDSFSTIIPRRLVGPLRVILHLEEKLNAVSGMDKIKVHEENK